MLKPYLFSAADGQEQFARLEKRSLDSSPEYEDQVKTILQDVILRGNSAVIEYIRRFDCSEMDLSNLEVSKEEISAAYEEIDEKFLITLKKAISNIKDFHKRQLPKSWIITRDDGTITGQLVRPVDAAGLYVPGGKGGDTPLCSSVIMNAVPAVIAGVNRIIMATPPNEQGRISPHLIVAAKEVGVDRIYKMGSAWAIAAMAFGTETIKKVDVIVGPGNIYVTLAKKLVAGTVGIDMIAGPSEILILADSSASADMLAADLLSQAEHDPMATSVLICDSMELAKDVSDALERQISSLARMDIAKKSLESNGLLLVVDDIDQAIDLANRIAPEHLELMVKDPWSVVSKIRHAGAIFLGKYSPEPIGDYIAGANHVLPTMGTARFSSALGVDTFIKKSSVICYSKDAMLAEAEDVIRMAEIEGLTAHANSVKVRL